MVNSNFTASPRKKDRTTFPDACAPAWEKARVANTKLGSTAMTPPAKADKPYGPPHIAKKKIETHPAIAACSKTNL